MKIKSLITAALLAVGLTAMNASAIEPKPGTELPQVLAGLSVSTTSPSWYGFYKVYWWSYNAESCTLDGDVVPTGGEKWATCRGRSLHVLKCSNASSQLTKIVEVDCHEFGDMD